ncbi:toxin-activating lysine-acyltransferase [Erwinia sp. CPCC 100877]|nr:toxin-activating lysine-acyltransferase [Erwinia sp. CPCC 100877]
MLYGNFSVQAPLVLGERLSEAEALGAAVWLWLHSPMHRDAPLHVLPSILLPIIKNRQYVLVSEEGRPVFFLSWMWLNAESEARYLTEATMMIRDEDWRSGERMWFRDFIAPFGHARTMLHLLRHEIFPHQCARYLWHRGKAVRPCIKTFRGRQVSSETFKSWKKYAPPVTTIHQC